MLETTTEVVGGRVWVFVKGIVAGQLDKKLYYCIPELCTPPLSKSSITTARTDRWLRNGVRGRRLLIAWTQDYSNTVLAALNFKKTILFLTTVGVEDLQSRRNSRTVAEGDLAASGSVVNAPAVQLSGSGRPVPHAGIEEQASRSARIERARVSGSDSGPELSGSATGVTEMRLRVLSVTETQAKECVPSLAQRVSTLLLDYCSDKDVKSRLKKMGDKWFVKCVERNEAGTVCEAVAVAATNKTDQAHCYRGIYISFLETEEPTVMMSMIWHPDESVPFPVEYQHLVPAVLSPNCAAPAIPLVWHAGKLIVAVEHVEAVVRVLVQLLSSSHLCCGVSQLQHSIPNGNYAEKMRWESYNGELKGLTSPAAPTMGVFATDSGGQVYGASVRALTCKRFVLVSGSNGILSTSSTAVCEECKPMKNTAVQFLYRKSIKDKQPERLSQLTQAVSTAVGDVTVSAKAADVRIAVSQLTKVNQMKIVDKSHSPLQQCV